MDRVKRGEDGDDDGDVDEDDHRDDDSPPDGTPAPPRERRRGSPPCASSSMASPGWGEVLPLVLGLHGNDGPLRDPPPWPPMMIAPSGRVPERA